MGIAWVAPTLSFMLRDESYAGFSITDDQASWMASLHEISRLLAFLISVPLLDIIGRRGVLTFAASLCLISSALIPLTKSIFVIYVSRLIFGLSNGIYIPTASLYLCENFKPTYRGVFGTMLIVCYYGGSLAEFCLANYLSYKTTAYTNTALSVLALFSQYLSIETPQHLLSKRRNEEALKHFLHLRGGTKVANIEMLKDEFQKVRNYVEKERQEKRPLWTVLASSSLHRKTVTMVLVFTFLASATGNDPVQSYASITFVQGVFTPTEYTIVFGALQLVAALFGTAIVEYVNRRTFLTFSLLVSALAHLGTATLFYLRTRTINIPYSSWWIFSTVTIYSMTFSSCIQPNAFLISGELLPQNVRSFGSGIGTFGFALVGFFLTKGFLLVDEAFGVYWNFVFYAVASLVFVLFVLLVLPESRGKSLLEIQAEIELRNGTK